MSLQQKASYLVGVQMADTIKRFELDLASLVQGLQDAATGKPPVVGLNQAEKIMGQYQMEFQAKQAKKGAERKDTNVKWLAENAKKPGVKTTASGLQYEVLASGAGKQAAMGTTVTVHYVGTLLDGTEFDSSIKRGQPAEFPLAPKSLIQGWLEAIPMMKEGDKWKLYIPSELAYGEQAPPNIGPNQILIFETELIKVVPTPEPGMVPGSAVPPIKVEPKPEPKAK
jgi:FKBP-type peptidyl-prolyl cis-trans isomerase FklB